MYKILIVEDDAVIAKSLKSHLEAWGYQVECGGFPKGNGGVPAF